MSSQFPLPTPSNSNTDSPRLALHGTSSTLPPPPTFPRNGHPPPHRSPSLGNVSIKKRPSGSLIPGPLTQLPPALPLSMPHPRQTPHVKPTVPDAPPPSPRKASSRPPSVNSPEEVSSLDFHTTEPMFASPTSANFEAVLTPTFQSKSSVKSRPPSLKSARQPSVRSRSSSTAIGLVEEVTPWELYPPIPEKNTKYHIPSQAVPEQTSSTLQTTLTGSVEEVTPWELVPPPETLRKPASRATSYLKSVDEVSVSQSFDSEGNDYAPSSPGSPAIQPSHISTTSSQDKVQKTGPAEDVTPWELEPGPTVNPIAEDSGDVGRFTSGRLRSSLTLAQVEDITPWELHPASSVRRPADSSASETDRPNISGGSVIKKKPSRSGNPFAANNKTLSDLAFVRGRKHGSLPSKSQLMSSSTQHPRHRTAPIEFLPTRSYDDGGEGVSEIFPTQTLTNSNSSKSLIGAPPSPVTATLTRSADTDASTKSHFNPSTADRKILSQLEFFKDAHDKEFVRKGKGYQQQGGGVTPGKLHHVYHEKDAPYPRCYDSRAQDLDVWEIMVCHQICESWTWHVFEMPPRTVLDIGCGTGSWVVQAAGEWKDCHFWGIDLVPIQPNFNTLGDRDLKQRVHWVHHNILNGLPFENEQFDYIHIKRIGLGVPENQWDGLFEECNRVLKSGGAFEMIEEDLIFPGNPIDNSQLPRTVSMKSDRDPQRWSSQSSQTSNNQVEVQNQPTSPGTASDTLTSPVSSSSTTMPGSPLSPMTNPTSMSHIDFPEPSAVSLDSTKPSPVPTHDLSHNSNPPVPPSHVDSQPGLTAKPTLYVRTPSNAQANSRFSNSAVSLLNAFGHHASTSGSELAAAIHKRRLSGLTSPSNDEHLLAMRSQGDPSLLVQPEVPAGETPAHTGKQSTRPESYLLKQYMAPMNPRDHTILDTIYSEMLSSRFINAAPLSLLQNYLEYHFTDIRTHPPVLFSFPPTALLHSESRYVTDSEPESESSDEISSDDDEAPNAFRPKQPKHKKQPGSTTTRRSRYRSTLGRPMDKNLADTRVLSRRDLIHHQSPYISLDESRAYAFSPSTPGKPTGPMRISRMPNATLNFDLKTLNMHLHLRAVDILGCSESMWEWVLQYQADVEKKKTLQGFHTGQRIRPMQSEASLDSTASTTAVDPVMNGIAELTREDYEILLSNFEMDMQDQASVDYALQEQVNWHVSSSPRDIRRKAFDEACKKWDRWVIEQERRARYLANRHPVEPGETRNDNPGLPEQHRYSRGGLLTPSASKDGIIHNQSSGEVKSDKGSSAKQDLSPFSPVPFSPSRLPPHERLSRAFRVYVAWKARDTNSPNQAVTTSTGLESPATPA